MKKALDIRLVVLFLAGVGTAALWLMLSVPWSSHIEIGLLYPVLHRVIGVNGPWMMSVGHALFAFVTALVTAVCVVFVFGNIRWRLLGVFVFGYLVGQFLNGWWSANSIAYLMTYLPNWLFPIFFTLAGAFLSSRMPGIWSDNNFKKEAATQRL